MSNATIVCLICKELLLDKIKATKCGHMYHVNCIAQWILTVPSCPHCRKHIKLIDLFTIYPTYSDDSIQELVELQKEIDSLTAKLRTANEKAEKCANEASRYSTDLTETEKKLEVQKAIADDLQNRVTILQQHEKYLKEQNKTVKQLQDENRKMKEHLQLLSGMDKVLHDSTPEVEAMLTLYTDNRTSVTFAVALKRALSEAIKERDSIKKTLNMMLKAEENGRKEELSAKVQNCEADSYNSKKRKIFGPVLRSQSDTIGTTSSPISLSNTSKHTVLHVPSAVHPVSKRRKIIVPPSTYESDDSDTPFQNEESDVNKENVSELCALMNSNISATDSPAEGAGSPYLPVRRGWMNIGQQLRRNPSNSKP